MKLLRAFGIVLAVGACGVIVFWLSKQQDLQQVKLDKLQAQAGAARNRENEYASQIPSQAEIDAVDEHSLTPLMEAARYDNLEKATKLIQMGANVNTKTKLTALHIAAAFGDVKMVNLLLDHGADASLSLPIKDYTMREMTPLMMAVRYSQGAAFDALLARDPKPANLNDLFGVAVEMVGRKGSAEIVPSPVRLTTPQTGPSSQEEMAARRIKVLQRYTELQDSKEHIFEALLALNPDLKFNNSHCLFEAIFDKQPKVVNALLTHGADPNASTNGATALNIAVANIGEGDSEEDIIAKGGALGHDPQPEIIASTQIAEALLDRGANVNKADARGITPLLFFAGESSPTALEYVLRFHPNLEAKDAEGLTALSVAAAHNNLASVRDLLAVHANVNALDNKGYSPLMLAVDDGQNDKSHSETGQVERPNADGHPEMVKLLLKAGASPGFVGTDGMTALKLAYKGHFSVVISLLSPPGS